MQLQELIIQVLEVKLQVLKVKMQVLWSNKAGSKIDNVEILLNKMKANAGL